MCIAGGCPAATAICIHQLRSEGSAQAWGGALQADMVMGRDRRSKGWGTLNFETEADAERAIQVHSYCSLQTQGRHHMPFPLTLPLLFHIWYLYVSDVEPHHNVRTTNHVCSP